MVPHHTHKWVVGFQPGAGAIGQLGSVTIGTYLILLYHPVLVFTPLYFLRILRLPCHRRLRPLKVEPPLFPPPF